MYKYNGVDTGADSLTAFAKEGYKGTAGLNVPKDISPLDVALKRLRGNVPLVSQPRPKPACPELLRHSGGCREEWVLTLRSSASKTFH